MTSFLCDGMLGTLATYLRMCGYDTAFALDRDLTDPDALQAWAVADGRTLLTRNRSLAARVEDAILVAAHAPTDQLAELRCAGVELTLPEEPERCSHCNAALIPAGSDEPRPDYAPPASERPAWRCPDCGQWFWRGSHWANLRERLPDESATP